MGARVRKQVGGGNVLTSWHVPEPNWFDTRADLGSYLIAYLGAHLGSRISEIRALLGHVDEKILIHFGRENKNILVYFECKYEKLGDFFGSYVGPKIFEIWVRDRKSVV